MGICALGLTLRRHNYQTVSLKFVMKSLCDSQGVWPLNDQIWNHSTSFYYLNLIVEIGAEWSSGQQFHPQPRVYNAVVIQLFHLSWFYKRFQRDKVLVYQNSKFEIVWGIFTILIRLLKSAKMARRSPDSSEFEALLKPNYLILTSFEDVQC